MAAEVRKITGIYGGVGSDFEGENVGKELGAVGYLTKPVRADQLVAMVELDLPPGR